MERELFVLPFGPAIDARNTLSGFVADIDVIREHMEWQKLAFKNSESFGRDMEGTGELCDLFPDNWAILCAKGYHGLPKDLRITTLKKTPVNGWLTAAEKTRNQRIFR